MRDMYKALAMLALDKGLRDGVLAVAGKKDVAAYARGKVVPSTALPPTQANDYDLGWEVQPKYEALKAIDGLLRGKNLFLAAYEIAEVNRWAIKEGVAGRPKPFVVQMTNIGNYLEAEGLTAANVTERELVLIGALIIDPDVRTSLLAGNLDKAWFGYADHVADAGALSTIQDKLRAAFPDNKKADLEARDFASASWSPDGCPGRAYLYQTMFHFNV